MVKTYLILLVLTIPNVVSKHCETKNHKGTEWSCENYRNFPTDLYNASKVEKLKLEGNDFDLPQLEKLTSEHLQLYKLPNLVELQLKDYRFREIEPGAFQNGGKLANLTLQWNRMEKLDPQAFTDLPNLQKLEISYQFGTILKYFEIPEFANLENLTELILNYDSILYLKSNFFKNLKSLQILDLSLNGLTILDNREAFSPLENLKVLTLRWNSVTFVSPEVFADLQNLEILDLSGNKRFKGFKNGTQFHNLNLIELDLGNCQLQYIEEDLFQNLGNLKELRLNRNRLSHIPSKTFSTLKNLEKLSLDSNSIKTLEPDIFSGLGNLTSLDLRFNQLKSLEWKVLRNLKTLSIIKLRQNPWQCDCQVWYLRKYLEQRKIDLGKNYYSPMCTTFGAKGEKPIPIQYGGFMTWKDINPEELNCLAFANITKLSADKEPKLGESINLQCEFSGDLPLQVSWMRGDVILRNFTLLEDEPLHSRILMEYNFKLTIPNFKEEDAGLYKVIVLNEAGEMEKSEYFELFKEPPTLDSAAEARSEQNLGENSQNEASSNLPLQVNTIKADVNFTLADDEPLNIRTRNESNEVKIPKYEGP